MQRFKYFATRWLINRFTMEEMNEIIISFLLQKILMENV